MILLQNLALRPMARAGRKLAIEEANPRDVAPSQDSRLRYHIDAARWSTRAQGHSHLQAESLRPESD